MGRPVFLEGEAGVGKTAVAEVLSKVLHAPLIRLQCYEGLDISSAVYDWNYARQMLEIRLLEASGARGQAEGDAGGLQPRVYDPKAALERDRL